MVHVVAQICKPGHALVPRGTQRPGWVGGIMVVVAKYIHMFANVRIANPERGISKAVKIKERFAGYQQTMEELVQLA